MRTSATQSYQMSRHQKRDQHYLGQGSAGGVQRGERGRNGEGKSQRKEGVMEEKVEQKGQYQCKVFGSSNGYN